MAQAAAEPLAARHDDRRVGRRPGPHLDHPSQLGDAARQRARARAEGRASAAAARRPSWCSTRRATSCARGAARARATSGRSRTTASTWTTRATSGSAATARRTRTSSSSPRKGSSCCRSGALRQERRQQRSGEFRAGREDLGRSEDERGVHRRRLSEPARRGARRRHRQDEALLGRVREQAGRRRPGQVRPEGAAAAAVPHPRPLRGAHQRRPGLRMRPPGEPRSRCSRRKASS